LQAAEAEVVDVALQVLSAYGLQGDDALHAVRALRSLVHGFATLEAAGGFGLALDLDESFSRLMRGFLAGIANTSHPGSLAKGKTHPPSPLP